MILQTNIVEDLLICQHGHQPSGVTKSIGKFVILVNEEEFFLQHDPTYCGEVSGAIDGNGTFWDLNRSMDNYS